MKAAENQSCITSNNKSFGYNEVHGQKGNKMVTCKKASFITWRWDFRAKLNLPALFTCKIPNFGQKFCHSTEQDNPTLKGKKVMAREQDMQNVISSNSQY